MTGDRPRVLYLEPFEAGSHRQFGDVLTRGIDADWTRLGLPGRHWKWRMRGAAAYFATEHADALQEPYDVVFASSYVALAELVGLVPRLAAIPSILYFHENQFAYPSQGGETAERDNHYGFTQLVSGLAATHLVFNSRYNRHSFLAGGSQLLARMPDAVPPDWIETLRRRSRVLAVPLDLPALEEEELIDLPRRAPVRAQGPIILWNHRWEHDKGPDVFFALLRRLAERGVPFRLAVCGESYRRRPPVFDEAREALSDRIVHWGHADGRDAYLALLRRAHLAISTAGHEFFGVSVLEATWCGARPLVPDRLAYPELLPLEHRYVDDAALAEETERLCRLWAAGAFDLRADRRGLVERYAGTRGLAGYRELIANP